MSNEHSELHDSAAQAHYVLARLSGEEGVLEQIENGQWDDDLASRQAVSDAAALLRAGAENSRYTREALGMLRQEGLWSTEGPVAEARHAAEKRLPFNRKERYFTGTVFPMIVASDGFAHLDRLLALCGLDVHVEPSLNGDQDLQFFTEYSFKESVFTKEDRKRFAGAPKGGDTPDIVLVGPDWLLALEAKMFDQPSVASLNDQLSRQWAFVSYWAREFGFDPSRVAHLALLPRALSSRLGALTRPTLTWEELAAAYANVAPRYWLAQLDYANTSGLGAPVDALYGVNAHGHRTGAELAEGSLLPGPGDSTDLDLGIPFDYMGRAGGLDGKALAEDLATGRWKTQKYEVRVGDAPNANWFAISDFLDRVTATGS